MAGTQNGTVHFVGSVVIWWLLLKELEVEGKFDFWKVNGRAALE